VFQAPYWSCNGAIEYVFITLHIFRLMDDNAGVMMSERQPYFLFDAEYFRQYFVRGGFP
jgi:hypothetical protein